MKRLKLNQSLSKTGRTVYKLLSLGKDYRDGYVEEQAYSVFASQVSQMRKSRGWKQTDLAEKAGLHQSSVSEVESPSRYGPTVGTMLKIASAFDVALTVKMVPFSEYLISASTGKQYEVKSFDEDFESDGDFYKPNKVMNSSCESLRFELPKHVPLIDIDGKRIHTEDSALCS